MHGKGIVMRNAVLVMVATGLFAAPVQAAHWSDARPGTFVGARLTLGGKTGTRPSAALTIAPTQHRISGSGMSSMKIGEGIAFNLAPGAKPTLTLAGGRADALLGLQRGADHNSDRKLGVSTGGWVAIGVGAALLVGGAVFYNAATSCEDHDDEC